jgi:hypothetical protein
MFNILTALYFYGWSILVGFKKEKKKKKKSLPTDPNFEDHVIGNTHIFFLALAGTSLQ